MALRSLAFLLLAVSPAAADTSTRIGLSAAGGTAALPIERAGIVGTELALSRWYGPIGIAAEASLMMLTDTAREGAAWIGASARLRLGEGDGVFRALDGTKTRVDYGVNVEALIQREWWDFDRDVEPRTSRFTYGVGVSTFFGGTQRGKLVNMRASVRLLLVPASREPTITRMLGATDAPAQREVGIVFALGTELGVVH